MLLCKGEVCSKYPNWLSIRPDLTIRRTLGAWYVNVFSRNCPTQNCGQCDGRVILVVCNSSSCGMLLVVVGCGKIHLSDKDKWRL
eukprot:3474999-Pleurochrysis_carterae.AAC.1